jgi:hypothetical protein
MSLLRPPKKKGGRVSSGPDYRPYGASDYSAPPSAPPPITYGAPSTHDSAYDASFALAGKSRDDVLAYLAGQAQQLRTNYGYADDNFTLDLTNPFGQAQLLKKSYDQSKTGTENSYASRGQQTTGAYNRMQGENLSQYQQGEDRLQKSYIADRANLAYQAQQALNQYGIDTTNAEGSALDRAIAARQAYQVQPTASRGLASNERVATSKRDGGQWVYRQVNGKWQRVRKAS